MSTDGGAVWDSVGELLNEGECALLASEYFPGMVLWGGSWPGGVIRMSTSSGGSWFNVLELSENIQFSCFAQDGSDPFHIIAGGWSSSSGSSFYHSSDGGYTWEPSPHVLSEGMVNDILFNPYGPVLYATTAGIYVDDAGGGYIKVQDCSANALLLCGDQIFAGCDDSHVYVSNDWGDTWEDIGAFHRDDIDILSLENAGPGLWVYAGTDGFGTFRTPLVSGTSSPVSSPVIHPGVTVLETPVSGAATLVVPPRNSFTSLRVFDVSGRVVHTVPLAPSTSPVEVVVPGLPPGVYFTGLGGSDTHSRFVVIR